MNLYGYVWQNPLRYTDPSGLNGWTPGDAADKIDSLLERLRKYLTGLDPDAVNANTAINYAFNTYQGTVDLLRVGRGFGRYYFNDPCYQGADELFKDIGRASGIALSLAGPVKGVPGRVRASGPVRATPGPAPTGASNILGKGSTANPAKGTTLPRNLREQLAIEQAVANPTAGTRVPLTMSDPRWPAAQGWQKWQQIINPSGERINVHYLYNPVTGQIDDFKIVLPGPR